MPEKILFELMHYGLDRAPALVADPLVTFLCPTFGRAARQPTVLDECVYWFTQQVYPNKTMLILNDAPGQKLFTAVPDVKIVNWPYKIPTLGEKMNLMVMMSAGSICIPYEDDDISLPWRAGMAVAALAEYSYWTPGLWWYAEGDRDPVPDGKGVGHNCSAYRRSVFLGHYPATSRGHDAAIHSWALQNTSVNPATLVSPEWINYVYRWGVSQMHLSAQPDMEAAYDAADPGPDGTFQVRAVMGRDYAEIHRRLTGMA